MLSSTSAATGAGVAPTIAPIMVVTAMAGDAMNRLNLGRISVPFVRRHGDAMPEGIESVPAPVRIPASAVIHVAVARRGGVRTVGGGGRRPPG
jgi:hypothetical protein